MDTLTKAFCLFVPDEYLMERVMADEHRVVVMSTPNIATSHKLFMSIFNLATCNERGGNRDARRGTRFFLPEKTIDLAIESQSLPSVFLFYGWLVFLHEDRELIWFDKEGKRSETSTEWDSKKLKEIYSSGKSLLFTQHDSNILLKR